MDNQSSLGGPLCCCEKLCVNEMLYFFCTHQLSSVLYNKHCFCGHFRALHERFFDTNYPSFFSNYDFFSRDFQFTEIIKQFDGIYFNKFFFRTDIDDKIIYNIGILHSYFITLQKY